MSQMFRWAVALLLVVQTGCASAMAAKSEIPETVQTARREIWKRLSSGAASSATIAIMNKNRIIYSEGFGMRNREDSLPVRKNTQFNIGSISKIFTAAAVLLLVDDGLVNLDQPVTTYLPEFAATDERYREITVRMLLNHTSGLPGTNGKDAFGSQKNPSYVAETLEFLAAEGIKHQPGTISVYCNDGFTVAEGLIEKITGKSYAAFLNKRIFKPMHMKNSSCFFKDGNTNIALVYNTSTGLPKPVEYVSVMGSGGITATAEDLCRYANVLYRNRLFSAGSLAEYMKAQYGADTALGVLPGFNCGLGWDSVSAKRFADEGVTILAKNGGTQQFSSQLHAIPAHQLSVALIFAGEGVDVGNAIDEITQALLKERGIVTGTTAAAVAPTRRTIPEELLAYAGYYATGSEIFKIEFDVATSQMIVKSFADGVFTQKYALQYNTDGCFYQAALKLKPVSQGTTNYILGYKYDAGYVFAEGIATSAAEWSGEAFADRKWLYRNGSAYDFCLFPSQTGTISELPGYVYLKAMGTYMLCRLQSAEAAGMCVSHGRDILGISLLSSNGETRLKYGNFRFSDAKTIQLAVHGDTVTIGSLGDNEWRSVGSAAAFGCAPPAGSRIIILTSGFTRRYDSLFNGATPVSVEAGDYIGFMGKAGDTFQIGLQ